MKISKDKQKKIVGAVAGGIGVSLVLPLLAPVLGIVSGLPLVPLLLPAAIVGLGGWTGADNIHKIWK